MLFEHPKGTILFPPELLEIFRNHQQKSSDKPEAGGYLLGQLFEKQVVVSVATEPGPGDQFSRFFFWRNKKRGQKLLNYFWKKSSGKLGLVGEWHSHPEPYPTPSTLDIQEAKKSFNKNKFAIDFMILMIIGNRALVNTWVGILDKSGVHQLSRAGYQLWNDDCI